MKNIRTAILLTCLFVSSAAGQASFEIKDASKAFDVKAQIEKCASNGECTGQGTFSFFRKNAARPFQVIVVPETSYDPSGKRGGAGGTVAYEEQWVVGVGDYNFDGADDVTICNGRNGAYGERSFNVYLADRRTGKFVHSPKFSVLTEKNGMFELDKRKKTLKVTDKIGCCSHAVELYDIVRGQPRLIFQETEDSMTDSERTKITTRRLVGGKLRTTVKYKKIN